MERLAGGPTEAELSEAERQQEFIRTFSCQTEYVKPSNRYHWNVLINKYFHDGLTVTNLACL